MCLNFFKICMFSLLLFCFSVLKVFCENPITTIQVLDTYPTGGSKFVHKNPIFDGITLVLPKTPAQHSHPHHQTQTHQTHHGHYLPQNQPILQPLPLSAIPSPFHPLLLSPMVGPTYQPIFGSVILPKNFNKYRKTRNNYKPKYISSKDYYKQKKNRKYPKSINDRIREKDYEYEQGGDEEEQKEQQEEEQEEEEEEEENSHESEEDPLDYTHNEEMEKPLSYYEKLPPFGKKKPFKPMSKVKLKGSPQSSQSYSHERSVPRYSERTRKPVFKDWPQNKPKYNPKKSQSLFDNSQSLSTSDQFLRPKDQKNNEDELLLSDSPQVLSSDYRKKHPKKQRTATANQLYLKDMEENYDKEHKSPEEINEPAKLTQSLPKEDLDSNDDPNFYPHQYAIEIRWKGRNNIDYNLDAPNGDVGDREMHSSKELDHARHRKYKHEEEEHWHEKKWLKEGLRKAYLDGKHLPVQIVKPTLKLPNGDFSPLPMYAQPLPDGATIDQINQHFAIPTPNFRVNNRFMEWTKSAIPLNPLQNINYLTLYG